MTKYKAIKVDGVKHDYHRWLMEQELGRKLKKEDVEYIKEHYMPRDRTYGARALGRKYGVDRTTILGIVKGILYKNLD